MRRVIALAAPVPHHLGVLAAELDARYHELRPGDVVEPTATVEPGPFTSTRLPPPPPRLPSARPPRLYCEVVRRMTGSSTQPLLLAVWREARGGGAPSSPPSSPTVETSGEGAAETAAEARARAWARAMGRATDPGPGPAEAISTPEMIFYKRGDNLRQDFAALLLLEQADAPAPRPALRPALRPCLSLRPTRFPPPLSSSTAPSAPRGAG